MKYCEIKALAKVIGLNEESIDKIKQLKVCQYEEFVALYQDQDAFTKHV